MVLGPYQTKNVMPPFIIKGSGMKGVIPNGKLSHVFHIVTIGIDGRLILQLYNCGARAQMLIQKLCLVGILYEEDYMLIVEENEGLSMEENNTGSFLA